MSYSFCEIICFDNAIFFSCSISMPQPSSLTISATFPPSCLASIMIVPTLSFPLANRSWLVSIPWSAQFLIRCVNGSESDSTIVLSNSVSSPFIINLMSLFNFFCQFPDYSFKLRKRTSNWLHSGLKNYLLKIRNHMRHGDQC